MVQIDSQEFLDAFQVRFDNRPHSTDRAYNRNTMVRDVGRIYCSIRAVPTGIQLSDDTYWQVVTERIGVDINLSTVLTGDRQIATYDATTNAFTPTTLNTSSNFGIDDSGAEINPATTAPIESTNAIGFSLLPSNSTFNFQSYKPKNDNPLNTMMDFGVDMQGHLLTNVVSDPQSGTNFMPYYVRAGSGNRLPEDLENIGVTVTRVSGYQGEYAMVLSDGTARTRPRGTTGGTRNSALWRLYFFNFSGTGAEWFSEYNTTFTGTVLDFENATSSYLFLTLNAGAYILVNIRYNSDGTVTSLGTANLGTTRPDQFGFLQYPTEFSDAAALRFFSRTGNAISVFNANGGTAAHTYTGVRVFPWRDASYFIQPAADSDHLHFVDSDIEITLGGTDTRLVTPNATSSYFTSNTDFGIVFVYDRTITFIGHNRDGESGAGNTNDRSAINHDQITVHSSTFPERSLKGAMMADLGNSKAVLVWSDTELWFSGGGRSTRAQLGRTFYQGPNNRFSDEWPHSSNTFRRIFSTDNVIRQIYIHCTANTTCQIPTLKIRLNNGIVYAKGRTLSDGNMDNFYGPYYPYEQTNTGNKPISIDKDVNGITYRKLAL